MNPIEQTIETQKVKSLRSEFSSSVALTVHWNGMLMEDLTFHKYVDHLQVYFSGVRVEQLLGIPKQPAGISKTQVYAVVQSLEEWGIKDELVALCFDTTALNKNIGHHTDTCTLIENK